MGDFKISLEAARRNAGLTQSQVAKKIGVTKETVLKSMAGILNAAPCITA